jgi:DNA excision repair protein ERCC-8
MNARLFARAAGDLPSRDFARETTTILLHSFAHAPQHRFDGERTNGTQTYGSATSMAGRAAAVTTRTAATAVGGVADRSEAMWAHRDGVGALAIDKFDGRLLLSGGLTGAIRIWDLDQAPNPYDSIAFRPLSKIPRGTGSDRSSAAGTTTSDSASYHRNGITHLEFYPFDPDAFLSSSHDATVKLWSTTRATVQRTWAFPSRVHAHATSPLAARPVVACATEHPHPRLIDLRSGSALQTLIARGGAVLAVAWHPRREHVLATGHADGRVRLWDARHAYGAVAQLDQEDALGVMHRFRHAMAAGIGWDPTGTPHFRAAGRSHGAAVNGLAWTDDGQHIVSAGLDERVRVWDAATGANTLTNFGPTIRNTLAMHKSMFVAPTGLVKGCSPLLFWPNDHEILALDLHNGTTVSRLRAPGMMDLPDKKSMGIKTTNRITSIAWRGAGGDGRSLGPAMGGSSSVGAVYSAHTDGQIRVWMPRLEGPEEDVVENEELGEEDEARKRKRKAVDDAYRSLMGRQVTFT